MLLNIIDFQEGSQMLESYGINFRNRKSTVTWLNNTDLGHLTF